MGGPPLKVMTYNIKTGGQDRGDRRRLDRVIEVIAGQRPDVLALQELEGFRRDGLMDRVAEAVGMCAFLARSWTGQPVAVLLRPPGRVVSAGSTRRPFHHAAARVGVATDRGVLTVIAAHLHPGCGSRRLREAAWLASTARRDRMVLLMGDLNSLDPWADHRERIARLPVPHRARHLRRGSTTAVDTRAVAALARAGFVDLFRQVRAGPKDYTAPTERGGGYEFSGMRLDYVMATPPLADLARGCRVVTGGASESASDHYPVVAELNLSFAA